MLPEFGQILHNNLVGEECSYFVEALLYYIRQELARIFWNVNQKSWPGDPNHLEHFALWHTCKCDWGPLPAGIEWHPYYNWGGVPTDPDWDQTEAEKPNFAFDGVEVRWYKNFGRSMNTNITDWTTEQWHVWFYKCISAIHNWEKETDYVNNDGTRASKEQTIIRT